MVMLHFHKRLFLSFNVNNEPILQRIVCWLKERSLETWEERLGGRKCDGHLLQPRVFHHPDVYFVNIIVHFS